MYVSALDKCSYTLDFRNGRLVAHFNSINVGSGVLSDGLYMMDTVEMFVNYVDGAKCIRKNENMKIILCYGIDVCGIFLGPASKD